MYQMLYHTVPSVAIDPTISLFLKSIDNATIIPENENNNTGVNIAPPKRWILCIITSFPPCVFLLVLAL
jgi:hypothetical protein